MRTCLKSNRNLKDYRSFAKGCCPKVRRAQAPSLALPWRSGLSVRTPTSQNELRLLKFNPKLRKRHPTTSHRLRINFRRTKTPVRIPHQHAPDCNCLKLNRFIPDLPCHSQRHEQPPGASKNRKPLATASRAHEETPPGRLSPQWSDVFPVVD